MFKWKNTPRLQNNALPLCCKAFRQLKRSTLLAHSLSSPCLLFFSFSAVKKRKKEEVLDVTKKEQNKKPTQNQFLSWSPSLSSMLISFSWPSPISPFSPHPSPSPLRSTHPLSYTWRHRLKRFPPTNILFPPSLLLLPFTSLKHSYPIKKITKHLAPPT